MVADAYQPCKLNANWVGWQQGALPSNHKALAEKEQSVASHGQHTAHTKLQLETISALRHLSTVSSNQSNLDAPIFQMFPEKNKTLRWRPDYQRSY